MAPQSLAGCYYSIVQRLESTPCAKDSAITIRSRSRNNAVRQLDQIFGKLLLIMTVDDKKTQYRDKERGGACHAERSEASLPALWQTLRCAQGDMTA